MEFVHYTKPIVYSSIAILQDGSDIFAFDTVQWQGHVYPRVYIAWAMPVGSKDANRLGLRWIIRTQYEWLVRHHECHVSYLVPNITIHFASIFYCEQHKTWELDGKDYNPYLGILNYLGEPPEKEIEAENFRRGDPREEDREV